MLPFGEMKGVWFGRKFQVKLFIHINILNEWKGVFAMSLNKQLQSYKGLVSAQGARINALKAKHAAISDKIEKEVQHHFHSESLISRLKKEKLLIKEQIEGLRDAS